VNGTTVVAGAVDSALGLVLLGALGWAAFAIGRGIVQGFRERSQRRPGGDLPDDAAASVRAAARALARKHGPYTSSARELDDDDHFQRAVAALRRRALATDRLIALAQDADVWTSRIALAVLAEREDLPAEWAPFVVRQLEDAPYDQAGLFLRTLARARQPVLASVLGHVDDVLDVDLADLVAARAEREPVDAELLEDVSAGVGPELEALVEGYGHLLPDTFAEAVAAWRATSIDLEFLRPYGGIWERPYDEPETLVNARRAQLLAQLGDLLTAEPAQSIVLVGEHGVGKTRLIRVAADVLPEDWIVFDATATAINAGASYIGELEGRVEELVRNLEPLNAVWVFPQLEQALYAGQHSRSPHGLLDALLPHVESGALRIVAEVTPAAWEQLVAERPRVAGAFARLRVPPATEAEAIDIAVDALEQGETGVEASDQVLAESLELAQQFLPGLASPGNVVRLVSATAEAVAADGAATLETADVLATLAAVSGLPLALLDPTKPLDLDDVHAFFEERILGQPDAIACLVDRIALVKAGLTDPGRPLGVFLFVGPTGTGKTEIAKALAEFLFGSAQRLIRLDMSEYQTPESLERIITDSTIDGRGAPLIASVRKDPFAVVLLDEFEKAAQPIWDLFLQLFDDGRLTDHHGRTTDFRRCVVILTSNIGSAIARGPGLGFQLGSEPFRPGNVERELQRTFRPEFLNRLDRVVVFRPFERTQMRTLLEKELADVLQRRGLRSRQWAVEFDESALDFLIEAGFTPELGARPLKRAVEQHVLAQLARAIVEERVPEGEQFLFVSAAQGRIDVRFVDPDADSSEPATDVPAKPEGEGESVRELVLTPRATAAARRLLLAEVDRIEAAVLGGELQERKRRSLEALQEPGFWEDEARFAVLGEAEYLDRLEAATRTAVKLGRRLERHSGRNGDGPGELVALLASRLHVLDRALAGLETGAPSDVFLRIRPAGSAGPEADALVDVLAAMYLGWAERRGMRAERVRSTPPGELLAVTGLGAGTILLDEAGLHVLESPDPRSGDDHATTRVTALVEVAAWPSRTDSEPQSLPERAAQALAASPPERRVVRRYRHEPAPLVRDAVRGYRTGRIDRVLDGDFDLF
jgi:ATP-dependent Clp protease ATP-binding subunit ClpC